SYGGFNRGFGRRWFRAGYDQAGWPAGPHGAGQFGTGANMAFRRSLFDEIGYFDPALDVGTPTNGGGDLRIFFPVLHRGYLLHYGPAALVRHRHRTDWNGLVRQIEGWGTGYYAFSIRSGEEFPRERFRFRGVFRWWLRDWIYRKWRQAGRNRDARMRELIR